MTGRRFTRSVLKTDSSTTTAAAGNNNDASMEVEDTDNNNHHNRRTLPRRRSSQTSENTNPILDDMSDIELDLSDAITTTTSNKTIDDNVRTVSEEQVTANDDIDMEIGKLDDDEEQWPSPPSNNSLSNNDTSHTMATYQQQYYGGRSADNDKLKSYRISHLQHRISTLETQVSSLSSSNSSSAANSTINATKVLPAYQPMSQTEEEMLKRRISEMEYELQMRRNRTNRLRKLIMDYVTLPSIVMPLEGEGGILEGEGSMLNGEGMQQQLDVLNEHQFGLPMLNMEGEGGANVVSPIVQMNVTNGEQFDGLDSLPDLPVMNLDNVEDNGSSEGQSGKKRGYAEV